MQNMPHFNIALRKNAVESEPMPGSSSETLAADGYTRLFFC
jgi:hypothetical protein